MKIDAPDNLHREREFALIAETDDDRNCLRRFIELRGRCSLRACTFQFEIPNKSRPLEREVTRADFRLIDDAVFAPREVDSPAAKK
jgi:hypothetical protein